MSFWTIARRPRWIAALFAALAVAAGFAALGQWQLERSIESSAPPPVETETVLPLEDASTPQTPLPADTTGQLVTAEVSFVAGDYVVLSDRTNVSAPGYWVVGHAVTASGAGLAVALGWTDSADAAASVIRTLDQGDPNSTVTGRLLPTESPQQSDFEAGVRSALAVPELLNLWTDVSAAGVHGGYVIADTAPPGLQVIDAPSPISEVSLNLLNIFYAVEWVLFAGFAIFLWYRLVKDALEEEQAAALEAATGDPTRDPATVE